MIYGEMHEKKNSWNCSAFGSFRELSNLKWITKKWMMAVGELAQQRSFFMDDEMSLKWVGVRWPVPAAENRADLNNTSPVVSTQRVCLYVCILKRKS